MLKPVNYGRIRERLASLIRAKGIDIKPWDITPAGGRVRNGTAFEYDGVRWWGRGKVTSFDGLASGMDIDLCGYETMTNCVRYGICLDHFYRDPACSYNVYADVRNDRFQSDLPNSLNFELDKLQEVKLDLQLHPCAVVGCTEIETALHHFMPRSIAATNGIDADDWPHCWLCRKHHALWHKLATPGLLKPGWKG
jgi:hypothetical protein